MKLYILILAAAVSGAGFVYAQEQASDLRAVSAELVQEPYSDSKITTQQWNTYHAHVAKILSNNRSSYSYEAGKLETYSDPKACIMIAFTTPGHKAHPAWVTTRLVVEGKKITVDVFGYYAGDKTAFTEFEARMNEMAGETLRTFRKPA